MLLIFNQQLNCFRSPWELNSAALTCHGTSGVEESVPRQHRVSLELCALGDGHCMLSPLTRFVSCRRGICVLCSRCQQVSGLLEILHRGSYQAGYGGCSPSRSLGEIWWVTLCWVSRDGSARSMLSICSGGTRLFVALHIAALAQFPVCMRTHV